MKIYLSEMMDYVLINQYVNIYILGNRGVINKYSGLYPNVFGYPVNAIVKRVYSDNDKLCIECNLN